MNATNIDIDISTGTSVFPKKPYLKPEIIQTIGFIFDTPCQNGGSIDMAQKTPPRYVKGCKTKVGTIDTSSYDLANTPFSSPASEKRTVVIRIVMTTINHEWTCRGTNKSETIVTSVPTMIPRPTPPAMNPKIITFVGTGATSNSSIFFWNFCEKNDDDTLAYELVIADIMIRPGTMNSIYENPPMSPIRPPIILPKMMK